MKRLENLSDIASRQLGGLEATPTLMAKIKLEAAERKQPRTFRAYVRPALAVCAALVLCVGAAMTLSPDSGITSVPAPTENVLDTRAAGVETQPTVQPRTGDVPQGSISMSAGLQRTSGTLFVQGDNAAFPLVTLNGATYRLLETPDALDSSLLGETVGTVSEFNIEPALASGGVVSNVIACGENVYAVGGNGSALVAASVNGSLRVFQRVSYAGTAIIGAETLADTLCAAEDVKWIDIAGMGRVEEPGDVLLLMNTLYELSDYSGTAFTTGASMQLGLKNGLVLQLMAGDDAVSACGSWSCPDFFEAFRQAVK